ncbi:MAG: TlpA family protein disulfide reductase [Sphingobacteriales bacterium]|nr:MAG: TlpA family protein disulfide reductase [Sphingobacteriales bacterium]
MIFLSACRTINTKTEIIHNIVDFNGYKKYIEEQKDVLLLVNFWATWCKPCVEELPYFIKANQTYQNKDFKILFVSLDRAADFETRVLPFAQQKKMQTDLLLLNDVKNMNTWISAINPNWTGAIPATILYQNGKQIYFHEGQLSEKELNQLINKFYKMKKVQ